MSNIVINEYGQRYEVLGGEWVALPDGDSYREVWLISVDKGLRSRWPVWVFETEFINEFRAEGIEGEHVRAEIHQRYQAELQEIRPALAASGVLSSVLDDAIQVGTSLQGGKVQVTLSPEAAVALAVTLAIVQKGRS